MLPITTGGLIMVILGSCGVIYGFQAALLGFQDMFSFSKTPASRQPHTTHILLQTALFINF